MVEVHRATLEWRKRWNAFFKLTHKDTDTHKIVMDAAFHPHRDMYPSSTFISGCRRRKKQYKDAETKMVSTTKATTKAKMLRKRPGRNIKLGSWSEGETFGGSEPKRGREIATLDR